MATKNRIFIAFAIEDESSRNLLVGQARNEKSPFAFTNFSVYDPWHPDVWKKECTSRIKGCDGMIALVSKDTAKATGELWEVKTAKAEGVPVLGVYTTVDNRPASLPAEFSGVRIVGWTWANISSFLNNL